MDDVELDRRATEIAFQQKLPYAKALERVVALERKGIGPGFPRAGTQADAQLDARARARAAQRGVSYAEALSEVVELMTTGAAFGSDADTGNVAFSEIGAAQPTARARIEADWIEIFKVGTHVSDQGAEITFSQPDLERMARSYRPELREAPLVVGHPETDAPARGWVAALRAAPDGRLMMRAKQVDPMFAEQVKAGSFKKRSVSLYAPRNALNPTPGGWYLRHVGFLGATQPGVPGLRDIAFSAP